MTSAEASPYRWAILAVCVLGFMQTQAAGIIMAAYFWTYALMQVPVGVLTDPARAG